jgi:hypothetical protein
VKRSSIVWGLFLALACRGDLKTDPSQDPAAMASVQGNGQIAEVGTAVPVAPTVLVTTEAGDPAQGVEVSFAVTQGGGTVTGATVITGVDGLASVASWTLGTAVGNNTLSATSAGLAGSPITFSAASRPGPAVQVQLLTAPPATVGNGEVFTPQPSVQLQDVFGNPDEAGGDAVTVSVAGPAATLAGTTTVLTDGTGTAHFTDLRVQGDVGDYILSFSAQSLPPVTAPFHLSPGSAATLSKQAGDNQSAAAGTTLPVDLSVLVSDGSGNPVAGVPVTWTVLSGGGSISSSTVLTDAGGLAAVSWTIGAVAGSNTVSASASGFGVSFSATGVAGAPATLTRSAGNNQSAPAGTPVAIDPAVLVQDANGNPVEGVTVEFSVTSGGGSIQTAAGVTAANGIASGGTWTLGPAIGSNTMSALVAGLVGSPAVFIATGTPTTGPPAALLKITGDNQSGVVGLALAESLVVKVVDGAGAGIPEVTVNWSVVSGGGSVSSSAVTTDLAGLAAAQWTLGPGAGPHSVQVSAAGFTGVFSSVAVAGPPTGLVIETQPGDGQSGIALPQQPVIQLIDANNNPASLAGVAVTVSVSIGGGTVSGTLTVPTDGAGQARFTDLALVGLVGSWSLSFTAPGLGTIVSDPLSLAAGLPATLTKLAGDNQTAQVGTPVAVNPRVLVSDLSGNGVAGVTVDFTVTLGNGTIANASAPTNDVGRAFAGTWTLGPLSGVNTLTASSPGLVGSPALFTATGTTQPPGVPVAILKAGGDGQTAVAGTAVSESLLVHVVDANDIGVPGVTVTWSVLSGGGTLSAASGTTDGSGVTGVVWTLGTVAGSNSARASAAGFNTTFTGTGVPGPGASLVKQSGDNQSAPAGTAVAINPSVRVTDANGNAVSGVMVTFQVTGGGGSIGQPTAFTNGSGIATGGAWTLGLVAGSNSLQSSASGLGLSPVTFSATGTATPNVPIPLIDMAGGATYFGHSGRLYPGGNGVPAAHATAGALRARNIQPRGFNGNPNPGGKFVLLSIGMSNTAMEWCIFVFAQTCNSWSFTGQATADATVNHGEMVIANGARSGQDARTWDSPTASNYDLIRDSVLTPEGLSEKQVEVVWLKVVNKDPVISLPSTQADAVRLVSQVGDIIRALKVRYPNLQMVFLSSRIYAGYSTLQLNPEPYAYESGFAMKWLIEAQIDQMANGGVIVDPRAGNLNYNTVAPWIGWGPYLWADGLSPRSDGLTWAISDYESDLTHPNVAGQTKVAGMLLNFFKTDPRAACWFLGGQTCP